MITATEWLTTEQAASYLQVATVTMETWRARRQGPPFAKVGRTIRYRRADLDSWLEQNRRQFDAA
jgi:excisionase family DNA binding protein